jgi:hypothetical protein
MKFTHLFLVSAAIAVLSGCGTPPKSPDELRTLVKADGMGASHDEFVVNKPFRQVSDIMKKKWMSCLDTTTSIRVPRGNGLYGVDSYAFKPTSSIKGQHMELALQQKNTTANNITVGDPPPDGFFIMVADITAMNSNSTKVSLQKLSLGFDGVMKRSRQWAEGTSTACPDLTQ